MQIIIDNDERLETPLVLSDLVTRINYSSVLEKLTGADFMISPLILPLTPGTLPRHCENGILVQVKRGLDFSASITSSRLKESISRMKAITGSSAQRVLLFVGTFTAQVAPSGSGMTVAEINGRLAHSQFHSESRALAWSTVQMGFSQWGFWGGRAERIDSTETLQDWVETQIRALQRPDVRVFYPDKLTSADFPDEPLRDVIPVAPWKFFLASLPGIGPKTIDALVDFLGDRPARILDHLTNLSGKSGAHGVGPKTIEKVREILGLKPWQYLALQEDKLIAHDHIEYWDGMRCPGCPNRGKEPITPDEGQTYLPCLEEDCSKWN